MARAGHRPRYRELGPDHRERGPAHRLDRAAGPVPPGSWRGWRTGRPWTAPPVLGAGDEPARSHPAPGSRERQAVSAVDAVAGLGDGSRIARLVLRDPVGTAAVQ